MKRLFLALVSVAALTGTAAAADLSRPMPAPYYKAPIVAPMFSWTGFYIGLNGGGGFGSSSWDSTGSRNISGGLVGGESLSGHPPWVPAHDRGAGEL